MGIVVGQFIDGISINGYEYLLDPENLEKVKVFNSKQEAADFLNSFLDEPHSLEQLEEEFAFLDTETDFDDPDKFK